MRCGSADLGRPSVQDGVTPGVGDVMSQWTCRTCGLTAVPVTFSDRAAYLEFKAQRAALFRPEPAPPAPDEGPAFRVSEEDLPPPTPPGRSAATRALAGMIGFAFLVAALGMLYAAAVAGGQAWLTLGSYAFVAVLFGAPFLALARRST